MHPEDDMKAETPSELDTEMAIDTAVDCDFEASTPASRLTQRHCWWLAYLLQYLVLTVVLGAGEVCLQIFMLGLGLLWPAILVSVCVNIVITYISIRSAIAPSTFTELWWAIKTRQVTSEQIEQHVQGAVLRIMGYAIAWELLSFALSRKLFWTQTSRQARSNDPTVFILTVIDKVHENSP